MIRLSIAADSATVTRARSGLIVELHLTIRDIVRAISEHMTAIPDWGEQTDMGSPRECVADHLLLALEPKEMVRLITGMALSSIDDTVDRATMSAISHLTSTVCRLARANPDDPGLREVVHHMRRESGVALCAAGQATGGAHD